MIDNTDINTLIVDTIMIDNENQAEFILKKLNEDVAVTNTMKEALSLYEKMLKEKEVDRPLIVKSDKCKEGLSFDLSHEDVVEQLLPMFEKEVYVVLPNDLIKGEDE